MALLVYACLVVALLASSRCCGLAVAVAGGEPTGGFTAVRLRERNFELQLASARTTCRATRGTGSTAACGSSGVLQSDKPHDRNSHTTPRTEIRMAVEDRKILLRPQQQYDDLSDAFLLLSLVNPGVRLLFGSVAVRGLRLRAVACPSCRCSRRRRDGHHADAARPRRRAAVLRPAGGGGPRPRPVVPAQRRPRRRRGEGGRVRRRRGEAARAGSSHYYKFGVYAQTHASRCMESRWKDIKIIKKD
jgi:hypothetical protein